MSRSMTPSEFAQVWGWAFARFSVGKRTPDGACKDASRVWLLPSHGGAFAAKVLTGAALDVDGVLAIPPPRVLRAPLTGRRGQVLTAATLHSATLPPRVEALLRSSLALRRLWEGVKGAGDSSRSGCDYSCVRELLRRGVSPALAFASLRLRLRPNVHSRDDEYLLRTVRNAFGDIRRSS